MTKPTLVFLFTAIVAVIFAMDDKPKPKTQSQLTRFFGRAPAVPPSGLPADDVDTEEQESPSDADEVSSANEDQPAEKRPKGTTGKLPPLKRRFHTRPNRKKTKESEVIEVIEPQVAEDPKTQDAPEVDLPSVVLDNGLPTADGTPAVAPDTPVRRQGNPPRENTEHVNTNWWTTKRKEWLEYNEDEDKLYCLACKEYQSQYRSENPRSQVDQKWKDGFNLESEPKNYQKVIDHTKKDRSQSHDTCLEWYRNGKPNSFEVRTQQLAEKRVEVVVAKDTKAHKATMNMLQLVFLEQQGNIPWNRHEEVVGWFDLLAPNADFGKGQMKTHRSRKSAKTMTIFMSDMLHEELVNKLRINTKPLSIITDESTDVTYEPHLVIYIRFHEEEGCLTKFFKLTEITDKSATGIFQTLKATFQADKLWEVVIKYLIAIVSDGASVLVGVRNGVAAKFKEEKRRLENTGMISIHCVAHRLELAYADTVTDLTKEPERGQVQDLLEHKHAIDAFDLDSRIEPDGGL